MVEQETGNDLSVKALVRMSGAEIDKLMKEGKIQFSDIPAKSDYWAWRNEQ